MWWTVAGIVGALGVALGAFGAHGIEPRLEAVDQLALVETWNTAARYHLVHALALLGVAAHPGSPNLAGWLFVAGTVLFAGSLYTMAGLVALGGPKIGWLGAITPLGGLCFIAGWLVLAFAARG